MTAFVMIAQLILGLGILVFVHEFGHFIAARIFKIRVPKFYMFFNPTFSLIRCKKVAGKWRFRFFAKNLPDTELQLDENHQPVLDEKGKPKYKIIDVTQLKDDDWRKYPQNTEYGVGWLPLGGYCQIAGMIDETQTIENMSSEPQPWEYRSKPAWQRLIVILGGVIVNMIVGVLLFAFVIHQYEKEYLPNDVITDGLYAYQSARDLGFQTGDKILSIDGETFDRYQDAVSPKMFFGGIVTVQRDGKEHNIVIGKEAYEILKTSKGSFLSPTNYPAQVDSVLNPLAKEVLHTGDFIVALNNEPISSFGQLTEKTSDYANQTVDLTIVRNTDTLKSSLGLDSNGKMGVLMKAKQYPTKAYTLSECFKYGWKDAVGNLWLNVKGFGKIFKGEEKLTSLSGPVGIAQIYGKHWQWSRFWYITGLLSVILAFMNVLPIPGLDGGHAIFTLIELLTGRKVPDSVMQYAQSFGMILLILLMIFVIGNDIFKLFM